MTDPVAADPEAAVVPDPDLGSATRSAPANLSPEQVERRQRLIDAAFELGAEGGYDAVQMRAVSQTANMAMATIYRYFSSKDDLLAAAMTEWIARLRGRVEQSPPRGDTTADRMVDVLHRACWAMERQPKLSEALVRSLASVDSSVREDEAVQSNMSSMGETVLAHLDPTVREDVLAVIGHVWYSTLVTWVNGRCDFATVMSELERACRVLITPYETAAVHEGP